MSGAFHDTRVAAVFEAYPPAVRKTLLAIRKLIFATAAKTKGVGPLEETLKWGQPSYLTAETKSGSTVRIDAVKGDDRQCAVHFICHTNLVVRFRELYGARLRLEGNRSILLATDAPLPGAELRHCIAMALTYKLGREGD
jgi:Domain of unknown function (DU1801)